MLSHNLPERESASSEMLCADDLVLMTETIEGLSNKFLKWKAAFESKGLKGNLGKTKEMVSSCITKDGMSKSKVDPCGVCSLRVKANSVLSEQCGKWTDGRCAGVKRVTPTLSRNLTCRIMRRKCWKGSGAGRKVMRLN